MISGRSLLTGLALTMLVACGGAGAESALARVSEADRGRAALDGKDAQVLAPQVFAEGDQALKAAREAEKAGDKEAAELYAEHALAAYQHAVSVARLARATDEQTQAQAALSKKNDEAQRFGAARVAAEREADDLDRQIKIQKEAIAPAASGPADPAREKARVVAAQSLVMQARLLCSAARLVSDKAPGLTEAEAAVTELEKKVVPDPGAKPAPIDAASRARAACLNALTKARRANAAPDSDASDTLLGELSRAADPKSPFDLAPSRDERGVIVTLRGLFKGDTLTSDATTALKELGRVAAAHPTFAIQVVVHDAAPPSAADSSADTRRGDAVAKTLHDGGAAAGKTKVEQAGARAPLFDPSDAKRREKNARIEIVFVSAS